jgi:hypothetical protein
MYECYNIAIKYLKDTYGYKCSYYTSSFSEKLRRARNRKEQKALIAAATDSDYMQVINPIPADDHNGNEIMLLVGQYYYGISVKKELYYKLLHMGVISN